MAWFCTGAGVAVAYESGNIFAHVDPEVFTGQDLVGLSSAGVSDHGRGMVLFDQLGLQGV